MDVSEPEDFDLEKFEEVGKEDTTSNTSSTKEGFDFQLEWEQELAESKDTTSSSISAHVQKDTGSSYSSGSWKDTMMRLILMRIMKVLCYIKEWNAEYQLVRQDMALLPRYSKEWSLLSEKLKLNIYRI